MRPHPSNDIEFEFGGLPVLSRRRLLTVAGGSAAALAFAINRPTAANAQTTNGSFNSDPFRLGVASGDPLQTAVVLWTRLAPRPFEPYGGVPPDSAILVDWQVATDENFSAIVRSGTATAHPEYAFSVHVDVGGLNPATEYFYRFRAGGQLSPGGRTRTAPLPSARAVSMSFAFASCNSFNAGYFDATGHMADEEADVIFFLGDYIYEYPLAASGSLRVNPPNMPSDFNTETGSLSRYRLQYAAHKSDPGIDARTPGLAVDRHLGRPRSRERLCLRRPGRPRQRRLPGPAGQRLPRIPTIRNRRSLVPSSPAPRSPAAPTAWIPTPVSNCATGPTRTCAGAACSAGTSAAGWTRT